MFWEGKKRGELTPYGGEGWMVAHLATQHGAPAGSVRLRIRDASKEKMLLRRRLGRSTQFDPSITLVKDQVQTAAKEACQDSFHEPLCTPTEKPCDVDSFVG